MKIKRAINRFRNRAFITMALLVAGFILVLSESR